MQIFIEAIHLNIWEVIEFGPFIPSMVVENATIEKLREEWDDDERRKEKIPPYSQNVMNAINQDI